MPYADAFQTLANGKLQLNNNVQVEKVHWIALPKSGDWRTNACDIEIDATQTFRDATLFGDVRLQITWGVGTIQKDVNGNEVYSFRVKDTASIIWADTFTSGERKTIHRSIDIPASLEGTPGLQQIVIVQYKVPYGSVTSDSCSYNLSFGFLLYSPTGSTGAPQPGQVFTDDNPNATGGIDWVPLAIIGGIAVAGLWGLAIAGKEFRGERAAAGAFAGAARSRAGSLGSELKGLGRSMKSLFKGKF